MITHDSIITPKSLDDNSKQEIDGDHVNEDDD